MRQTEAVTELVGRHSKQIKAFLSPLLDEKVLTLVEVGVAAVNGEEGVCQGAAGAVKGVTIAVLSELEPVRQIGSEQNGSERSAVFIHQRLGQDIHQVLTSVRR